MAQVSSCIFCRIVQKQDPATTIFFESPKVVVFSDIRPASDHHYLAVATEHIGTPKDLTLDHKELVNDMQQALKQVLQERAGINADESNEVSFGFHWPPFNSIKHLHMHAIYPTSKMGFLGRMMFKPESLWYRTPKYVLDNLQPAVTK